MKLTVIIPVYNGQEYITRCLDSLEKQSFTDFCVRLYDDGSKDQSSDVIRKYMASHPEMAISLVQQENHGVAETRNTGIQDCDTPYIAFMDQDDVIDPDYFQTYMDAMEGSGTDVVCGGYRRVSPESGKVSRVVRLNRDPWARFVVPAPWAHLYRTAFLKKHPIRFLKTAIGEDIYFSLMAYAYTEKVDTIPDTGYQWIDNPKSHSNHNQKTAQKAIDPFILLNALDRDLPSPCCIPEVYLEYFLYRYIVWYLLFTVRRTPRSVVESQYHKLFNWLKQRCPGFSRNRLISLHKPAGEPFSIRLSVWGFNLLYKAHIALPVLKCFAARG